MTLNEEIVNLDSNKRSSSRVYRILISWNDIDESQIRVFVDILLEEWNIKYLHLVLKECTFLNESNQLLLIWKLFESLENERDFRFIYWALVEITWFSPAERKELIKLFLELIQLNKNSDNPQNREEVIKYIKRALWQLKGYDKIDWFNPIQLNILKTIIKSDELVVA